MFDVPFLFIHKYECPQPLQLISVRQIARITQTWNNIRTFIQLRINSRTPQCNIILREKALKM